MIARIKTKTGFYDSIVFAIVVKGWNSRAIVFNQNYDKLEFVKMWKPKRNVFVYDSEETNDWIKKEKIQGYDWILKNMPKNFSKTITDPDILNKAKELQKQVESPKWFDIKVPNDIVGLMQCAFGFHDSYVKKIYMESEKKYICFDTTWGCEILFELDGNIKTNLFENYGQILSECGEYLEIFDASMFFENGLIYWIDDSYVKSGVNLDETILHYFCANHVRWKPIIL